MRKLTQEEIEEINKSVPYGQGIFTEPLGCDGIKELVIYMNWESSGLKGGSCWGDKPHRYTNETPNFDALDMALSKINPAITYLQYKGIDKKIRSTEKESWGYYGNYDNIGIKYIKLNDLYKLFGILDDDF